MKNAHRKERKIKRIPPSSTSSEVALDDETPLASESPASDQEPATQRLSMPVTSDGRIDVSRLREKTRDALRQALSDPELPVALGMSSTVTESGEDAAILAQLTSSLFTGVSALSVAFAMRAGYRSEHARVMVWTEDELKAVAPLTGKIAKKRLLPLISEEYRDECLLGYQIISIIGAKIMLLRETAKMPAQPQPTGTEEAS